MKLNLLEKLSLNEYYKVIIYISGLILIMSLFFETKAIDQVIVQIKAVKAVILGLVLWLGHEIFQTIANYLEIKRASEEDCVAAITFKYIFEIVILVVGLVIVFN